MKSKIIFSTIVCFFIVASCFSQSYSGGSGTQNDPYLISSKADMATLAMAVNDGNKYSGKYFLLTKDISNITTRIGNSSSNSFGGIFDGGGYILDVTIDVAGSDAQYAGVFGYTSGATIKNLGVTGSVSSVAAGSYSTNSYAGGICGYAISSTLSNCFNSGNVSSSSTPNSSGSSYYSYAGGICGYTSSVVNNCWNSGNVSSSSTYSPYSSFSYSYAGGICGYTSSVVNNCWNSGNVSSSSSSYYSSYYFYAGGICGYASKIANSFVVNSNITSIAGSQERNAGRIVANTDCIVEICYALSSTLVNGSIVRSHQ
jgi:hypothetical protein